MRSRSMSRHQGTEARPLPLDVLHRKEDAFTWIAVVDEFS